MKSLSKYIIESTDGIYCVLCEIETQKPYSSFLFANNIWCNNGNMDNIIKDVMTRLCKFNDIFKKFKMPVLQPRDPRGGSLKAISTFNGFELVLRFWYFDSNRWEQSNVKSNEPIFKEMTSRWSETEHEKENRYKSFEKSGINDFCKNNGYGNFNFK